MINRMRVTAPMFCDKGPYDGMYRVVVRGVLYMSREEMEAYSKSHKFKVSVEEKQDETPSDLPGLCVQLLGIHPRNNHHRNEGPDMIDREAVAKKMFPEWYEQIDDNHPLPPEILYKIDREVERLEAIDRELEVLYSQMPQWVARKLKLVIDDIRLEH